MTNIAKYFLILETLKFSETETDQEQLSDEQRIKHNLDTLKKFTRLELPEITHEIIEVLQVKQDKPLLISDADLTGLYGVYLQHVLLEIIKNSNFNSDAKEDLISTRHINLCIEAIQDLGVFTLRQQLHPRFCTAGVFTGANKQTPNYALLQLSIEFFGRVLQVRQFHISNSMELVMRDYMAAIFTLYLANNLKELTLHDEDLKQMQQKLNFIWHELTKMEYFRNLMLLKGIPGLPMEMQKQLHQELLQKLMSNDGFTTLVATLQTSAQKNQERGSQQTFEIVASIVANRGHSKRFQSVMIKQIFKFFHLCLLNEAMLESMGAGLLTLRKLYDLSKENQVIIGTILDELLKKLNSPEDLISGIVLMEHHELCLIIGLLFQLFCTSSVECLPSVLLIKFLPMLLQLYYNMPNDFQQKQQIACLITRCLNNRSVRDLQEIIEKLYTLNFDEEWQQLHERILIFPNTKQEMTLKIAPLEYKQEFSISLALPELLISSDHHILTYQIFMTLLKLMDTVVEDGASGVEDIDLLQTDEELIAFLNTKYPVKVEILLSLNTLISHQALKTQISENSSEFLQFLRALIEKRIEGLHRSESNDQTLLIMLTLTQEMLENSPDPEAFRDFLPALRRLQDKQANQLIQQRTDCLITLLNGGLKANAFHNSSAFNAARTLIESKEPHLQVYGIQMLLDLLRRKDQPTLANAHLIIALALTTLKDPESYTFLNCVRLFVGLVNVMEAQVLEVLSDEYLNDKASLDFRLVVGEAILKVSKELGPLSYKYKDVFLNGFMNGARSPLNEFRMSAFANLAQLCRTLSYQVHKFFQELLNLIDCELTTGKYLPAKRSAVMVLTDLLAGMDNLMDFEEILLPIYRLLKSLEADESCDEKIRVHASNGLKALSEKCKKLLFPEQQLHKEIQIFGINDKAKGNLKKHILEMN